MSFLNLLTADSLADGTLNHHPLNKNSPAWYAIRGNSLLDHGIDWSGNIEAAKKLLIEALRLNPDYAYGNLSMGLFYLTVKAPKEALHFLNRAKSLGLENSYLDFHLAIAQNITGDILGSMRTIENAIAKKDYDEFWYQKLINSKKKILSVPGFAKAINL